MRRAGIENCIRSFRIKREGVSLWRLTESDTLNLNWPEKVVLHLKCDSTVGRVILHLCNHRCTNVESRRVSLIASLTEGEGLGADFSCFLQGLNKKGSDFTRLTTQHKLLVLTQSENSFDWGSQSCLIKNSEILEVWHAACRILSQADLVLVSITSQISGAVAVGFLYGWGLYTVRCVENITLTVKAALSLSGQPIWAEIKIKFQRSLTRTHQHRCCPHVAKVDLSNFHGLSLTETVFAPHYIRQPFSVFASL